MSRCRSIWRAGLSPAVNSPPDGARCTREERHDGDHQFGDRDPYPRVEEPPSDLAEAALRIRKRANEYAGMASGFVRGEEHHVARVELIAAIFYELADLIEGKS